MARTRFKAKRTPEYAVITACVPENIGGIRQKFADLHLIYAIMQRYSITYIKLIEEEHRRCGEVLDLHAPVTENVRALENHIRVMFSAFLASHSSLMAYLRTVVDKQGVEAAKWLAEIREKSEALNSFERLRNMDTHHEPLHTLIGMRYRILGAASEVHSAIETKETHIHWPLSHEGVGFCPWGLADTAQFATQPGLIEYVTFSSILQLAHSDIHELVGLLENCKSKGLVVIDGRIVCGICADAAASPDLPEETGSGPAALAQGVP